MNERVDTIIIGGGQAGLSASYYLQRAGVEHLVLDKAARPADAWRNQRWDSFTLVTPNWSFNLPGADYDGPDPHGYMGRAEIVSRFERYVAQNQLPVRYGLTVTAVEPGANARGFTIHVNDNDQPEQNTFQAQRVVIATGIFQHNRLSAFASALPSSVQQLTSAQYRSPRMVEPGAVLVVGSGQSGAQIAEELYQAGHAVYLSVGSTGRVPRHYRGRDIYEWMMLTGFLDRTVDQMPFPNARRFSPPTITGKDGGHSLNLHRFYRDGVTLLGHLRGYADGCLNLAPDLHESLARADQFEANQLKAVDAFIEKASAAGKIPLPPPESVEVLQDAYAAPQIPSLDLRQAGIKTIIWAMGYNFDFSMVKFPVFDDTGFPVTHGGVSQAQGLYFCGLPWTDTLKSGLLLGISETAGRVAEQIQKQHLYH